MSQSPLNILLLGSGGRESALAWKMSQSPLCKNLYIAPGNGGTGRYGTNVAIRPTDFAAIDDFVKANGIELIVVGNEDPLVAGIQDYFEGSGVLVLGPSKEGAQLEGSKDSPSSSCAATISLRPATAVSHRRRWMMDASS